MPVFEQGYRRYVGERTAKSRAWIIAIQNVRPRMRWWGWLLVLAMDCVFGPYAIYAMLMFVVTIGTQTFGLKSVQAGKAAQVVFEGNEHFNPGTVLGLVQSDPLGLVWELLYHASYASVLFPAVVAAGILASDRRTGALQIYFSRPVTRVDYLAGKVLAVTGLVSLTTVIPCGVLWLESVAFGSSADFTWKTWVAPLVIVGASIPYVLWSVALVMSLSSIMRRPAVVGIAAIGVNMLLEAIGAILGQTLDRGWMVLQPSHAIGVLTAPICGLRVPDWINPAAAFGIGFVLPVALLALLWWRLKAIEVVT